MKRCKRCEWGDFTGQTIGQKDNRFYIRGWNDKGEPVKVWLYTTEFSSLLSAMFRQQEKYHASN